MLVDIRTKKIFSQHRCLTRYSLMLRNEGDQVKVKLIISTSTWTFMIKEDSIAGKHVVSFSVVYNNPVSIYFGSTC